MDGRRPAGQRRHDLVRVAIADGDLMKAAQIPLQGVTDASGLDPAQCRVAERCRGPDHTARRRAPPEEVREYPTFELAWMQLKTSSLPMISTSRFRSWFRSRGMPSSGKLRPAYRRLWLKNRILSAIHASPWACSTTFLTRRVALDVPADPRPGRRQARSRRTTRRRTRPGPTAAETARTPGVTSRS